MTTDPLGSLSATTIPKSVNEFRVGDYAILKRQVCRILELKKSVPGKHGSAKTMFIGRSLKTGKQVQEIGIKIMPWVQKLKAGQVIPNTGDDADIDVHKDCKNVSIK